MKTVVGIPDKFETEMEVHQVSALSPMEEATKEARGEAQLELLSVHDFSVSGKRDEVK